MIKKQKIICLDFEGTIAPELWPIIATETGIDLLKITTRDYPSFPDLMMKRIEIMNNHGIKLDDIIAIAENVEPEQEAVEFLNKLIKTVPKVVISSDLAEELALPLLAKLDNPLFFGHRFAINDDGSFDHYRFRQVDPKRRLVEAYLSLDMEVFASGDSYNDITMLETADKGFLFRATQKIQEEFPQFPHTTDYNILYEWLTSN